MGRIEFKQAAISMELKMRSFYAKMARKVRNAKSVELLDFLASEEFEHTKKIEDLSAVETDKALLDRAFESAGEIMGYLADDIIVRNKLSFTMEDDEEILKLAVKSEEDTKAFYSELYKYVDEPRLKAQIEIMISYEDDHTKKLKVLQNVLKKERGPGHGPAALKLD